MKIAPNIGKSMRMGYAAVGTVLMVAPFATGMDGWQRVLLPILGAGVVLTGGVGW